MLFQPKLEIIIIISIRWDCNLHFKLYISFIFAKIFKKEGANEMIHDDNFLNG